jgi:dTDP-4-dehydrorhamnose 3,5-epimerase
LSRLESNEVYVSASYTSKANSVRGMHYQSAPFQEAKLVTVLQGDIFDVVVDLDESLPLTERIHTFMISAQKPSCLFVPKGFAHGFQSLSDEVIVLYALDAEYNKASTRGFSPLSQTLKGLWPVEPQNLKSEDLAWPMLL